jgi:uncharacterized protein
MNITFDDHPGGFAITSYGPGWVRIGERRIEVACVVTPHALRLDLLPPAPEQLLESHFEALLELEPEIVLIGTGQRQRFVDQRHARLLAASGVGLEVMDTGAACRSFNVLLAEDRAVIAALYPG